VVLLGRFNGQGVLVDDNGRIRFVDDIERDKSIETQMKRFIAPSEETPSTVLAVADAEPQGQSVHELEKTPLEVWLRARPGVDFEKLVICKGKVIGGILIGDTGLEEVVENLILNRFDVGSIGVDLLDPSIDIEDYFD
jgi:hypothetical protein